MKKRTKGTRLSPLLIEVARLSSRAEEKAFCVSISDGAPMRERERERVANYLELPNNLMKNFQEKCIFPALQIYLYYIG